MTAVMVELNRQIGLNIKILRIKAGIKQDEFAFRLELSRGSVNNIESGRSSTTLEGLLKICYVLNCHPNDVLPLNFKFKLPNGRDFKAVKLNEKSKKIKAALAECERQQQAIVDQNKMHSA